MATNYIQPGDVLTLAAPYAVASGAGMLVGGIFAVALAAASNGANVQAQRGGVWTLPKLQADDVSVGAKLYWDNTNKRLTLTSSGNTLVGAAIAAAGTSATTVSVLLDGAVR